MSKRVVRRLQKLAWYWYWWYEIINTVLQTLHFFIFVITLSNEIVFKKNNSKAKCKKKHISKHVYTNFFGVHCIYK